LLNEEKNINIRIYLRNFNLSEKSDYTLWKAIKKLAIKKPQQISISIMKQNGYWARID